MEPGDFEPGIEVSPMGVNAVVSNARVQMKLRAVEPQGFSVGPVEQAAAMPATPRLGQCREVIDIKKLAPHQTVHYTESGHRNGVLRAVLERTDKPIALGSLHIINEARKIVGIVQVWTQLFDRREGERRFWWNQFSKHQQGMIMPRQHDDHEKLR